jgi:subtilase family serine protease
MRHRLTALVMALAAVAAVVAVPAAARTHQRHATTRHHRTHLRRAATRSHVRISPDGLAIQAPDPPRTRQARISAAGAACTTPAMDPGDASLNAAPRPPEPFVYSSYHCYGAQEMAKAYGVDKLHDQGDLGAGQTIVLVDSYGSPTAAHDLEWFHHTYYPDLPSPSFEQICQPGCKDYKNVGNGQSGSSGAEGWAGEAALDVEWAYAMAPLAHIVLVGVAPAETEGVQGFPALFSQISSLVDSEPAGTVFSMSFGITEETFGGAAQTQTARFDQVFKKGLRKGDTFLASSGDDGSAGVSKRHRESVYYTHPTAGWPASSPYVTAVGGTQLMQNWRWAPTSDTPFNADGTKNPAYFAWTDTTTTTQPAWNESWLPAATGGATSIIYGVPEWQASVLGTIQPRADNGGRKGRAVPDVAWDAAVNGGALVYTSFFPSTDRVGWHVYGGTSAASPQFAGVVALANEARADAAKGPIGWLNPVIYQQPAVTSTFDDVQAQSFGTTPSSTIDSNQLWSETDGQPVTPSGIPGMPVLAGWDETTGFGTPRASDLVTALTAATPATAP